MIFKLPTLTRYLIISIRCCRAHTLFSIIRDDIWGAINTEIISIVIAVMQIKTSTLLQLRWTDSVKNEVLDMVKEERNILQTIK